MVIEGFPGYEASCGSTCLSCSLGIFISPVKG
jgi:hypothetical protein